MNETQQIFMSIFAFAVGYAIAFSAKNIGVYWERWGALVCIFVYPMVFVVLGLLAAMIADMNNNLLSIVFLAGFITRILMKA